MTGKQCSGSVQRRAGRRLILWIAILCFTLSFPICFSLAAEETEPVPYVYDESDLLTDEQWEELEILAEEASEKHQCGIYFMALDDFTEYADDDDIQSAAQSLYLANDFGLGEEDDGIFLLLSMNERDYALVAHGSFARAAFGSSVMDAMCDHFLADFGNDRWADGIAGYISDGEQYAKMGRRAIAAGREVGNDDYDAIFSQNDSLGMVILIALLPSAIFVAILLRFQIKKVTKQTTAFDYIVDGKVDFRVKQDMFTHITRVRHRIDQNGAGHHSGGGSHGGGGGFSGKSGKF